MKGNNRGITLIALVVTIIVLLILASVSIRLLLGNNGILEKSRFAAFAEEMSSVEEQVILARGAEQTGAIINGTEDTITISEDGIFVAKYNDEQITDKLKRDIVELRENKRNSGMSQEEINAKYEALKNGEGNIDGLLYVNKKYAKGKDRTYLFDIKTNTAIKVPGKMIYGEEYHIYKWNTGSSVLAKVPKPEEPDLSEHKPLEDDWIPIYTIENYKKVATEEQNYDIYDLNGTKVGTYNMNKDAKYRMMNDIDFKSEGNVNPIKGFKGIFDGNGYYIKNIKVDTSDSTDTYYYYSKDNLMTSDNASTIKIGVPAGLFDRIESGKVENLGIDNANIVDILREENKYGSNVGILAGEMVGATIENCIIKNSYVTGTGESGYGPVGGLTAWVYNSENETIIKKVKIDNVEIKGSSITSGLVANTTGNIKISDCIVENSKIHMEATNVSTYETQAGILGHSYAKDHNINNCYVGSTIFSNNLPSYINNTIGGIFGGLYLDYNVVQSINISNCGVEDVVFGKANNIGGICGNTGYYIHNGITDITNCTLKGLKLDGTTIGGIIAYNTAEQLTISNCNVLGLDTTEASSNSNTNKAGIVGFMYYPKKCYITACNVTDSNILLNADNTNMSVVAGIVACVNGGSLEDALIKECNVINTTIKGSFDGTNKKSVTVAGIIGSSGGIGLDKCNLTDSKVLLETKNQYTGTEIRNTGDISGPIAVGLVGESTMSRSIPCAIKDCKITNSEIKSNYAGAIGVLGFGTYTSKMEIINCDIENSIIKGKRTTVGVTSYSSQNTLSIDSCDIKNTEITSEERNAAGIMHIGNYQTPITNCNVENCLIQNLEYVQYRDNSNPYADVAGIVSDTRDVNIENCSVKNTTLKNHYSNTGGIVASSWSSSDYTRAKVKDCVVENITIVSESGAVGAIAGNSMYLDIINCHVNNGTIQAKGPNVGGLQGYSNWYNTIENCSVKNLEITTEEGMVGGIVGNIGSPSIINTDIENVKINSKGRFVGGIAGIVLGGAYKTSTIKDCDVKSSIINSENCDVGGVVGHKDLEGEMDNCTVTSSQIVGKDNSVGGIVGTHVGIETDGENKSIIKNCKVQDSKITMTGADAKGLGGIVGQGSNITYGSGTSVKTTKNKIIDCKVLGTEIIGVDYVGGISGAATNNIENCLVDNKTTITGRNQVGGIQGFGGILGQESIKYLTYVRSYNTGVGTWKEYTITPTEYFNSSITGCEVKNTTISGTTDTNYIQGKNSYYVDGYTGTTGEDTITNCTYENTSLKSI